MYSIDSQKLILKLTQELCKRQLSVGDIDDLKIVLRFHEWSYYINNESLISDMDFDLLFNQLRKLEADNPLLITPDSPTQRVANDLTESKDAVKHLSPMLSLDNSYNPADLNSFDETIKKLTSIDSDVKITYCVEPKYDGGSVAFVYTADAIERAATRGNGSMGEEMTANAKTLPTIPLRATFSEHGIHQVELRGEAVIHKERFSKINEEREKAGLPVFANPRNAASGGLRMKNPNETRQRGIEVFLFQMGYAVDLDGNDVLKDMDSHYDQINLLGQLGFKIPTSQKKKCEGIAEVIEFIQSWEEKRDSYDYEIDGMVVKVDSQELQNKCGFTQHHPRWAIAYKFKAKQASTKLLDVEYQIGKIGSITPVAKLEPVQLAGVTISSVSLHNEEFIQTKDLRLGDTVLVERAGDVIPYIVKTIEEYRDGSEKKVVFPTHCPSCETKLIKSENEAAWRCVNSECPAQALQRMIYHVSKEAMDIDGFGKSYVEQFQALGWLRDMSDIYNLDYDSIASLEGFGQRSATNLKQAIDKAKSNPISRLLNSLTIHHLGKKASKLIAGEIQHVLDLKDWTTEHFTNIKDIGPVVADNVIAYFADQANIDLLERLEARGVNLYQKEEDKPVELATDGIFSGKTILFTGSLQTMGRKEAQQLAATAGAKAISAVSGNLDILVVGEKAGSKLKKAQALGTVDILTEEEFVKLISDK